MLVIWTVQYSGHPVTGLNRMILPPIYASFFYTFSVFLQFLNYLCSSVWVIYVKLVFLWFLPFSAFTCFPPLCVMTFVCKKNLKKELFISLLRDVKSTSPFDIIQTIEEMYTRVIWSYITEVNDTLLFCKCIESAIRS